MTTTDGAVLAARQQPGRAVTWPVRVVGYTVAVWSLGFAAVSGWQLATGRESDDRLAAYADGIAAMVILVLVLKVAGAILFGVLAVSFHRRHRTPWTVAMIGLLGAPVLLGVVLVIAPGILGGLGLLPS